MTVRVSTQIYLLDANGVRSGAPVARIDPANLTIQAGKSAVTEGKATVANPKLWGPAPRQKPNRYVAVTTVQRSDALRTATKRLLASAR